MKTTERYHRLFARYLTEDITPTEKRELFAFLAKRSNRELVTAWLRAHSSSDGMPVTGSSEFMAAQRIADRAGQRLLTQIPLADMEVKSARLKVFWLSRIGWAAASVLLVIGGWQFYEWMYGNERSLPAAVTLTHEVDASAALLKRQDGQTIRLATESNGVINSKSGVRYDDGTALVANGQATGSPEQYELITPRGSMYQVTLADGSRVHLNADSRLTYPSFFNGDVRKVILEGEGFFEIVKLEQGENKVPFLVEARGKTIEVLGTSFSVSAYADEPVVRAALVTGKIRMSAGNAQPVELHPRQAALSTVGRSDISVEEFDPAIATAWLNGDFAFEDQPLAIIFRTLSRWYSISVDYATVPHTRYSGVISRKLPLADVLAMLEKTGNLAMTIDGDKVVVKPKRKF